MYFPVRKNYIKVKDYIANKNMQSQQTKDQLPQWTYIKLLRTLLIGKNMCLTFFFSVSLYQIKHINNRKKCHLTGCISQQYYCLVHFPAFPNWWLLIRASNVYLKRNQILILLLRLHGCICFILAFKNPWKNVIYSQSLWNQCKEIPNSLQNRTS